MIRTLLARISQGHRTMRWPDGPAPALPERFRGLLRLHRDDAGIGVRGNRGHPGFYDAGLFDGDFGKGPSQYAGVVHGDVRDDNLVHQILEAEAEAVQATVQRAWVHRKDRGDLVRAGGSLDETAFDAEAELARFEVVNGESRRTAMVSINLAAALAGDATADIALQPHDLLTIRRIPQWAQQEVITIEGEVRFPGRYPVQRGETLASVLKRAGGLTGLALARHGGFGGEGFDWYYADETARNNQLRTTISGVSWAGGTTRKKTRNAPRPSSRRSSSSSSAGACDSP